MKKKIVHAIILARGGSKGIKNKNIKPIDQNEDDASYCKKIKKESGLIDLQKDNAEKILLKFRAYKGWPGVFFRYKNVDIKIQMEI